MQDFVFICLITDKGRGREGNIRVKRVTVDVVRDNS